MLITQPCPNPKASSARVLKVFFDQTMFKKLTFAEARIVRLVGWSDNNKNYASV